MRNHHLIADAHTLANQQLERLRILTLLLAKGRAREALPECQQDELDHWMFDLVCQAQEHLDTAATYMAQKGSTMVTEGVRL
ncbi:MAG: hypothetical protein ACTS5I_18155 [Rhodanobacter sp.]